MKFLCLAFGDEQKFSALTESEMRTLGEKCNAYDEELRKTGRLVASGSLGRGAKTMRWKGGKLRVTDGPFTEAKELVGGFVIRGRRLRRSDSDRFTAPRRAHGRRAGLGHRGAPDGLLPTKAGRRRGCGARRVAEM